ncbi:anaerobic ribonucleoside-triphosphate reductase-activating protein [Paenibacillus montaniterrae]|uniref:Anaerobic ribonucleoside-triphosphate reductase-activating protein n=1 Tax=Paenibacillus montaniterrae TaxID=429341 RepID=A0A920D1F1_9BACL|nr:anaerobic ribonucleoside-triphosphate reductase activating protein [Paenibacillus montaniterrae]GIP19523.1 anaerobic ribonucleoside-triphosphate reductase-activating protein [Paenibacillus montaniterrae]
MKIRLAAPMTFDSIVDGPGLRTVLWTQGCLHHCKGCHNPQTHPLDGGIEVEQQEVIEQLQQAKLQRGLTISGGEPFLQAAALITIAEAARKLGLDVWAYTGFTWEQLHNSAAVDYYERLKLLRLIDVLVDGRYMQHKASVKLLFRGSANQRLIDVQQSLQAGEAVLLQGA